MQKLFGKVLGTDHSKYEGDTGRALRGGAKSTTQDSGNGNGVGIAGPFRRLDENLVPVPRHAPRNSTWVSASTPVEREVQMNAIHVKHDVDLDRRVEEV